MQAQSQILFEFDQFMLRDKMLNDGAGIYSWILSPGEIQVEDDHGVQGHYDWTNDVRFIVKSAKVDGEYYPKTESFEDMRLTNKSFYFNEDSSKISFHFDNYEPPLGREIYVGHAIGYSMGGKECYFKNYYYEPWLLKAFVPARSKEPVYFGMQEFPEGSVELDNSDGTFDDWRDRNLFHNPCRILAGEDGADYDSFSPVFSGYIANDSADWSKLTITVQDVRASFTQPVANNLLTQDEYEHLGDSNNNAVKRVVYGTVYKVDAICLNENDTEADSYQFLLCDTSFNPVSSIQGVYVDGVQKYSSDYSVDYIAGIITISASLVIRGEGDDTEYLRDHKTSVTVSFSVGISNGVDIVKNLILNHAGRPFLSSFWNTSEVNAARSLSRSTSVCVDDDKELQKVIGDVCSDIDGYFFAQDDGKFSIRIYNESRVMSGIIPTWHFQSTPKKENNGDEYLTSAVIKYKKDHEEDTWLQYECLEYYDAAFARYKTERKKTFETNLVTEAQAQQKARTILQYCSNVQDIVSQELGWEYKDIEIMDFWACSPYSRVGEPEQWGIWEVLSREPDPESLSIKVKLRRIKDYNQETREWVSGEVNLTGIEVSGEILEAVEGLVSIVSIEVSGRIYMTTFDTIQDENGNDIVDEAGNPLIGVYNEEWE